MTTVSNHSQLSENSRFSDALRSAAAQSQSLSNFQNSGFIMPYEPAADVSLAQIALSKAIALNNARNQSQQNQSLPGQAAPDNSARRTRPKP